MSEEETFAAMQLGHDSLSNDCDLLILGEMGIAHNCSNGDFLCSFKQPVEKWTGTGIGISPEQLFRRFQS